MWFRHNAAASGISLHRNKPHYGMLSRSLCSVRLADNSTRSLLRSGLRNFVASHPARYGFGEWL
jgi:hypothetical protein